mgnify:CR=1 FL=1
MHLVNALPGVAAQGLIWGIMAIGVYITFRILDVADLTVDGTMATGGAAFIMLTMAGAPVPLAMLGAFLAGVLAGHRPVPHRLRHSGNPRRYPHPAGPVLRQPADHGTGQPARQLPTV